jgi:rod shape-determining protein MreD
MSMRNAQDRELYIPTKGGFILVSLLVALFLNLLPFTGLLLLLRPDFAALILLYWCLNQPAKVGMTSAFVMGLLMDVVNASVLGQQALAYSLLAFAAMLLRRRMYMFSLGQQSPQIALLLLVAQLTTWMTGMLAGVPSPGLGSMLPCFTGALLWVPLSAALRELRKPKQSMNVL